MRVCCRFAVSAARALPNHGGLTPPALGCTCVCASQKSPFYRHTFAPANRSGGREPAVGGGNAFARAIPQTCGRPSRCAGERYRDDGRVTTGGLRPPLLYLVARAFVGKIATSAMHERNCARSNGRQPAVVCGIAFARAIPQKGGRPSPLGLANLIAIAVAGEASVVFRVTGRWHCERASA
jgi:hypothetical protein